MRLNIKNSLSIIPSDVDSIVGSYGDIITSKIDGKPYFFYKQWYQVGSSELEYFPAMLVDNIVVPETGLFVEGAVPLIIGIINT